MNKLYRLQRAIVERWHLRSTPETIDVRVTSDHINRGTPRMARACPVALALKDAMPGATQVIVSYSYLSVRVVGASWFTLVGYVGVTDNETGRLEDWIRRFDLDGVVEPTTFHLRRTSVFTSRGKLTYNY